MLKPLLWCFETGFKMALVVLSGTQWRSVMWLVVCGCHA
ncbi:hypothetical protein ECDEC12A_4475 [Escherichia coli DEC12A]|uniref:Uncharacterized protein n=1 Tax=Escherichia albertii (strain TW07627) TaxID=502347 RepID=A0ABC9NS17_ESCAT|nr:hypothetical protein ESCAB7627_4685 [Escherichia albertii TW07627]EHX26213.1 hypothetical protein ECDEC12A_4475 [Escherichia coli DEC12A]EHX26554.1 hypothetical protein ECDEC12C_4593 [Escherichia coli DEC12C]EHX43791.1 hypothetical protein ECDEC12E_4382 [Escherichia coli DEC12E]EIQ03713.1 hypothetical protein SF285071_4574 [Shigella flexneri 2850-71]